MLTNGWILLAVNTHHAQLGDLASTAQVEKCQANDTHFLVRSGGTTSYKPGGVLSSTDLEAVWSEKQKRILRIFHRYRYYGTRHLPSIH